MAREPQRIKRRERKNITAGVAHVNASFNNTMITITDAQGNAISWSSAGMMGFKGSRKSTPYAAQVAADDAGKKAAEHGVRTLEVEVKGPGSGRESALRARQAGGFQITPIPGVTPNRDSGVGAARARRAAAAAREAGGRFPDPVDPRRGPDPAQWRAPVQAAAGLRRGLDLR